MTTQTATFFALPDVAARFATLCTQIRTAADQRKVYRKTLAELENLTSRDLADLGIAPSSIKQIAYDAAYGA